MVNNPQLPVPKNTEDFLLTHIRSTTDSSEILKYLYLSWKSLGQVAPVKTLPAIATGRNRSQKDLLSAFNGPITDTSLSTNRPWTRFSQITTCRDGGSGGGGGQIQTGNIIILCVQ